jgi:hypothetical protein
MNLPTLTAVTGIYGIKDSGLHGRYSEIVIRSPARDLRLRCNHDTDEILVSTSPRRRRASQVRFVTGRFRVEWIWAMTNQQGYSDGFRIQIATKKRNHVFEFIAIGSCIEVYESAHIEY